MKLVIIESPYAGDIDRNIAYAKKAIHDCLIKGEAPIASHLLFTQEGVLDDNKPEERKLGMNAGLEWYRVADKIIFYIDHGMSNGMLEAESMAHRMGLDVEYRYLSS